jgi:competence protein ComEA
MKRSKGTFEEMMDMLANEGYKVVHVPHHTIEDYNATYNVTCQGKHIITNAAKKLRIPMGEIWISELWRPYEKFILFHELREIHYRTCGLGRDEAHECAVRDGESLWRNEPLWHKMVHDIVEMDRRTAEKKERSRKLRRV